MLFIKIPLEILELSNKNIDSYILELLFKQF